MKLFSKLMKKSEEYKKKNFPPIPVPPIPEDEGKRAYADMDEPEKVDNEEEECEEMRSDIPSGINIRILLSGRKKKKNG